MTTEETMNKIKELTEEKRIFESINKGLKTDRVAKITVAGNDGISEYIPERLRKILIELSETAQQVILNEAEQLMKPTPVVVISDLTNKDVTGHG